MQNEILLQTTSVCLSKIKLHDWFKSYYVSVPLLLLWEIMECFNEAYWPNSNYRLTQKQLQTMDTTRLVTEGY